MARLKRKQIFVDRRVQGALMLRCISYWGLCLLMLVLMLLCWRVYTGPPHLFQTHINEMWLQFGPAAVASILLLPIIIIDVIRVSNRFCGPMQRLRGAMRQLAAGEHVRPVHFRDNDFWQELAEEFNAVIARVQSDGTSSVTANSPEEPDATEFNESEPVEQVAGSG